jgi:hypothetical protein
MKVVKALEEKKRLPAEEELKVVKAQADKRDAWEDACVLRAEARMANMEL